MTIISNFVPAQEPANEPNSYKFSDFVSYETHITVDGDGDGHAAATFAVKLHGQRFGVHRLSGRVDLVEHLEKALAGQFWKYLPNGFDCEVSQA